MPSPLYLLLAKIIIGIALACSVAWIIDYSRARAWSNPVGQTLLTKTIIITLLLCMSELTAFFRFRSMELQVIRWSDLVLLALIGPVMVWRMRVFHQVGGAFTLCSNGHRVSAAAKFCPLCGVSTTEGRQETCDR